MGLRIPNGILDIYAPFLVNFASTPARFLMFVDPLLPYGFGMRIFKAYGASKPIGKNEESFDNYANENSTHEIITDVHDDFSEILLSPDSKKSIESMWFKVKNSTETPDWHTNLNSIAEASKEDPTSPLLYQNDTLPEINESEANGGLEMKISQRKNEFFDEFIQK